MTRFLNTRAGRLVLPLAALVVCAVLTLVNIANSPDIITDEATYALTGQSIANDNSLTFGALPIVVHPPLFFLASGGWLGLTGQNHGEIVSAITSLRYLNGVFDLGIVLVCGLLARAWLSRDVRANPAWLMPLAMVLVGTDGFLLRFGRAALIEPMAIFFGVLALLVSWALRNARLPFYVAGTGVAIGVALLCKQPALFLVGAPLLAAVLRLRWREIGRQLLALVAGLFVFGSFVAWAYQSGNGSALYETQTLNVRRLLGLVQVNGLNKESSAAGGGAASSIKDTFAQFAGAYVLFLTGAVALVVLAWQLVRERRRDSISEGKTTLLALGVLSYAFLAYSVLFGASNQQLTMYTVPAAAILTAWLVLAPEPLARLRRTGRVLVHAASVVAAIGLLVSTVAGFAFYPLRNDNATVRVEKYIKANIAPCTPINTTGNATHWSFTLRTNPISGFADGPSALRAGTHLFLLSPRDAKYGYGTSSPAFNKWIQDNGRKLYSAPTNVYEDISLWQVGDVPKPARSDPSQCVSPFRSPIPQLPAPALRFLAFFGGAIGIVVVVTGGSVLIGRLRTRRREPEHVPAHAEP